MKQTSLPVWLPLCEASVRESQSCCMQGVVFPLQQPCEGGKDLQLAICHSQSVVVIRCGKFPAFSFKLTHASDWLLHKNARMLFPIFCSTPYLCTLPNLAHLKFGSPHPLQQPTIQQRPPSDLQHGETQLHQRMSKGESLKN